MHSIDLTADELIARLMAIAQTERVSILDSSGVGHLGSHLLIAGLEPVEVIEIGNEDVGTSLLSLDEKLSGDHSAIFTISYGLGLKIERIRRLEKQRTVSDEPDVFIALYDVLVVHDYETRQTFLTGNREHFDAVTSKILNTPAISLASEAPASVKYKSTRGDYIESIRAIQELIRAGDTYQTNLTQRIEVELHESQTPQQIFANLRRHHPAPFAAFIQRMSSTVISASPERFFTIGKSDQSDSRVISTSPIKGTRRRGTNAREDDELRNDLLSSEKDIAENTMIVDLLRNDLGRVCEYGSVRVQKLCDLEEHPTLFHLVSTITGTLRESVAFSDILESLFPSGSITGAPKHRTMQIIDCLEKEDRGLSMGTIGIYVPRQMELDFDIQTSVAIRTMVVRDHVASFNVGGGITADSDVEREYEESLLKAKALLTALNAEREHNHKL